MSREEYEDEGMSRRLYPGPRTNTYMMAMSLLAGLGIMDNAYPEPRRRNMQGELPIGIKNRTERPKQDKVGKFEVVRMWADHKGQRYYDLRNGQTVRVKPGHADFDPTKDKA